MEVRGEGSCGENWVAEGGARDGGCAEVVDGVDGIALAL